MYIKAKHAQAAGYAGLIILNPNNFPIIDKFGFGDQALETPMSLPTVVINTASSPVSLLKALSSSSEVMLNLQHSFQGVRMSMLRESHSSLKRWKDFFQTKGKSFRGSLLSKKLGHLPLLQSFQCAQLSLMMSASTANNTQFSDINEHNIQALSRSHTTMHSAHFQLGNLFHYHISPIQPTRAYDHYVKSLESYENYVNIHSEDTAFSAAPLVYLPTLTNIADLLYKYDIEGESESDDNAIDGKRMKLDRKETEFMSYKERAQIQAVFLFAEYVRVDIVKHLNHGSNSELVSVTPHLMYDWDVLRSSMTDSPFPIIHEFRPLCSESCVKNISHCEGLEINLFGQPLPYKLDLADSMIPPLSPQGRHFDAAHHHMFYADSCEYPSPVNCTSSGKSKTTQASELFAKAVSPKQYFGIFNNAYVMGEGGVTITFNVSLLKSLDGDSGSQPKLFVDIFVWIPSPAYFVTLHSLEASADSSALVNDIVIKLATLLEFSSPVSSDSETSDHSTKNDTEINFVVNALQMSCSNYYHWMTQCLPRVMMTLDTILEVKKNDTTSLSVTDDLASTCAFKNGNNVDTMTLIVYVPASQYQYVSGIPIAKSPSFVKETLQMLGYDNDSNYILSRASCDMLSSVLPGRFCNQSLPSVNVALRFEPFNARGVSMMSEVVIVPDWRFSTHYPPSLVDTTASWLNDVLNMLETVRKESISADLLTVSTAMYHQFSIMLGNRQGLEFGIPRSLASNLQSRLAADIHQSIIAAKGQQGNRNEVHRLKHCMKDMEGNNTHTYIVIISRAEKNPHSRSRHLVDEQGVITALLNMEHEENGSTLPRPLQVVVLLPDGDCQSYVSPVFVNVTSSSNNSKELLLCDCLGKSGHGKGMGRLQRAREVLSRAAVVVGVHGAGLTNLLWAPKGTPLVEISLFTNRHRDFMHFSAALSSTYYIVMVRDYNRIAAFDEQIDVNATVLARTVKMALAL